MSRSVRDLRDIINISRLSIKDDLTEEFSSSDDSTISIEKDCDSDDLANYINSRPNSSMGQSSFQVPYTGRPVSAESVNIGVKSGSRYRPHTAPDNSQFDTSRYSHNDTETSISSKNNISKLKTFHNKYTPVPPIGKFHKSSEKLTQPSVSTKSKKVKKNRRNCHKDVTKDPKISTPNTVGVDINSNGCINKSTGQKEKYSIKKNFDDIFHYVDGTIIASWLEKCNYSLQCLVNFMESDHNFVDFAQFFLSQLPFQKYSELLDLEFSIILDHFKYAFHSGFINRNIEESDLQNLATCIIKEYPNELKKDVEGPKLLLDIIILFCDGKTDAYRTLLKDIHCRSSDKQNVQWLLAIRAFGLLSFISGIIKFFENVVNLREIYIDDKVSITEELLFSIDNLIIQAVQCDYLHVLDYFYTNHKVDFSKILDEKRKNLVSIACSGKKYEVLYYLLNLSPKINVNEKSQNGSTPLQCAVTYNDLKLASILIEHGANVNAWNEEAEGATVLHTAVLLGNQEMVKFLLEHGADKSALMGVPATTTALSLAEDLNHSEIIKLLENKT